MTFTYLVNWHYMPKRSRASRFPRSRTLITGIRKDSLDRGSAPPKTSAYTTQHKYKRKHTYFQALSWIRNHNASFQRSRTCPRQYLTCPLRLKNDPTALTRRTESNENRWFLIHYPYLKIWDGRYSAACGIPRQCLQAHRLQNSNYIYILKQKCMTTMT
jgi:hypothetical protein